MRDITQLKAEFEQLFGTLSPKQLWALVKLAKHVRLRCRNNSAFNNFMGSMFPYATFKTVTKTRKNWKTGLEENYPGLAIIVNGVEEKQEEGED